MPDLDKQLVTTLEGSLRAELARLDEYEERRKRDADERDKAREEATAERDAETREMLERVLALHQDSLKLQVEEEQQKAERRKWLAKYVLGPTGLLTALITAVAVWAQSQKPPEPTSVEQVETVTTEVTTKIDSRVKTIEDHLDKNDVKIERTVDLLLDQQVQQSDGIDYIVDKIEKAHPNTRNMKVPESVRNGRTKAEAIKQSGRIDFDPAHPLADLE